jgi:hypothetical protein
MYRELLPLPTADGLFLLSDIDYGHPACFESMHELAVLYKVQGKYGDAEPLLLDAFNGRESKLGPDHPYTIESLNELVSLYEAWGKSELADQWRAKLADRQAKQE